MSINFDVYQEQSTILACFPISLTDLEGELENVGTIQAGRVATAGSFHDIAIGDTSGCMFNTSGGAIISTTDFGKGILGVHMGVVWHQDLENKDDQVIMPEIEEANRRIL